MKIAVVTENGTTISKHFGKATHYLVITVEAGQVVHKEMIEKAGHRHFSGEVHLDGPESHEQGHGMDAASEHKHDQMIAPVLDCAAVIAGGMGRGAYLSIEQANLRPFITDLADPEGAALAYAAGTLVNHTERLH